MNSQIDDAKLWLDAHDGRRNRLRERIETQGMDTVKPHELLEFLLGYVIQRKDTHRVARALLDRFGDLRTILRATLDELLGVEGVGENTAEWIVDLGNACFTCDWAWQGESIFMLSYADMYRYVLRLRHKLAPPQSVQLLMDMDGRLIYREGLCPSASWSEAETLLEGLDMVITARAKSAIVAVYFDEPFPMPEKHDGVRARAYACTLRAVGCELLDVVFVGEGHIVSLRQQGMMDAESKDHILRSLREDYIRNMPKDQPNTGGNIL